MKQEKGCNQEDERKCAFAADRCLQAAVGDRGVCAGIPPLPLLLLQHQLQASAGAVHHPGQQVRCHSRQFAVRMAPFQRWQ